MSNLTQAIWVEFLKARRSKVPLFTALGFAMIPLGGGFFMVVLKNPEMARRVGLISMKANLTMGTADWNTYLQFLIMAVGAGGLVLFGVIASWVFGREYSDHTIKDLLALPTSRSIIVISKFVVVAMWSFGLTIMLCLLTLCIGFALNLPPQPLRFFVESGIAVMLAASLTTILATPIAFSASVGRGYLPPIGIIIVSLVISQLVNSAGWGEYFPWSIPALYSQGESLGAVSFIIVILTSIIGFIGTLLWWERADETS